MKEKAARILVVAIMVVSTMMFLPWVYMTGIYYIARYIVMAMTMAAICLCFSLSDTLSVRFVRLLALTIACMLLLRVFLPIRVNDITQLAITLLTVMIGTCLSFGEREWSSLLFYYTLCISAVTICNCLVFAGNLKIPEYYMVNEGKNQIGAMLAIGSAACFHFGMKLMDRRVQLWSAAFLAALCIILIRARSDFFALVAVALLVTVKDASWKFKPSVANILTVLAVTMSMVILYTAFLGDNMHTFMFGGKNSSTFNEITSHRWTRNQQGIDILIHHNTTVDDIRSHAKIPFIHNYPLLHVVRYGLFSLPLLAFYFYFAGSTLFELFRKRKSDVTQIGWVVCSIPLIISLAEPNFPYGPGLVQLPAFLLLGFSLRPRKVHHVKSQNESRVLHICNDFNNSKVHTSLYRELDQMGVEQTVFVPMRKGAGENNGFESENTKIIYSRILRPLHRLFFFHKVERTVREIEKSVDFENITVCHATTLFSDGMVAWELNRRHGIPYVVAVRNSDINAFLRYMPHLWWCHRAVLENSDKVVFVTPSLKNRLLGHWTLYGIRDCVSDKATVIPNGVSPYWIDHQARKDKAMHSDNILFVGNMTPNKNVMRLAEAVLELRKTRPDVHLDIVGDGGRDEKRVLTLAARHPETITCHGRVTDPGAMRRIYEKNDIFAMVSKSETFGLVYIEALSQGLPVVWSRGEAIDGMFAKMVGEAADPRDTKDIEAKILKILENYKDYEDLENVELDSFRWSKIAPVYSSLYKFITSR